jgi:hypothetical protein
MAIGIGVFSEVPKITLQAAGIGVEIDEDESRPSAEFDLHQAILRRVEIPRLFHAIGHDQPAIEIVGPRVIGADDRTALAVGLD